MRAVVCSGEIGTGSLQSSDVVIDRETRSLTERRTPAPGHKRPDRSFCKKPTQRVVHAGMSDRETLGGGSPQLVRSRSSLGRGNCISTWNCNPGDEVTRMTLEAPFELSALWPFAMSLAAVFVA